MDWRSALKITASLVNIDYDRLHSFLHRYIVSLELGEMSEEDFWKIVAQEYDYNGHSHELAKAWIDGMSRIVPTCELISELTKFYKVIACTNNWPGLVENQAKNIPEYRLFDMIIDSSQEKVRKPDHKMYKLVEERIYVTGQDVFFIDDSKQNCDAAKEYGWQTYLFDMADDRGQKCANELRSLLL